MFKKPVWDDLSFVTWCIILLEVHQKMVHCSHKEMDMVRNNTQVDCGVLNDAQLVLMDPKCAKKIPPHHYTTSTSLNHWDKAGWSMLSCSLHQILTLHLTVAEIKTPQTRQRFYNLLLSSFGESVWIVSSVCCSYLTGAAPGVVFCCWSPSASGFDVLCVQRCILQILVVNEWFIWVTVAFLSSLTSLVHSPLISRRHFHPHNCRSLDIFSFSDHSL